MDIAQKLTILADAAKYDVACTSSGSDRAAEAGKLGNAGSAGCCHSFTPDGRCISLLKVLMTNVCCYDCAYCVNRCSNDVPRAAFTPRELAELTIGFYRRNYIEGLFLSSGVLKSPDYTMEIMIEALRLLREEYGFRGYIHAKAVPGCSPLLLDQLGRLADRLSINMELPSQRSLSVLAPEKSKQGILAPMRQIQESVAGDAETTALMRRKNMYLTQVRVPKKQRAFAPAGQSTQMIIGASPENDFQILSLSSALYQKMQLKRVFFSAYLPVTTNPLLPQTTRVQLNREHRLYQADWLMRFYHFDAGEIIDPAHPYLDLDLDPKANWAVNNLEHFPLEVNKASYEALLRVPGIGVVGAKKIVKARRHTTLHESELKKLGIAYKRARYFITCAGKYQGAGQSFDPLAIRAQLAAPINGGRHGRRADKAIPGQLNLFEDMQENPALPGGAETQKAFALQDARARQLETPRHNGTGDRYLSHSTKAARMTTPTVTSEVDGPYLDVAYVYDDTLEGLFTAIFKAYERHEDPTDVCPPHLFQPRLGQQVIRIDTDVALAERVATGILSTCGTDTFNFVKKAALCDDPDAGSDVYRFVRLAMRRGPRTMHDIAHPLVAPLEKRRTFIWSESERIRQFVRFQELEGGIYFAHIAPRAKVVPLVMDGFAARYNTQPFIIYDQTHRMAGVYEGPTSCPSQCQMWGNPHWYLVPVDQESDLNIPPTTQNETIMQAAWKGFYRATTITTRLNPELRQHFMPKRFWENLIELQPDYTPRGAALAISR